MNVPALDADRRFWQGTAAAAEPTLLCGSDRSTPTASGAPGGYRSKSLADPVADRVVADPNAVLAAAWSHVLAIFTGNSTVTFGVSVGRTGAVLPLVVSAELGQSWADRLALMRAALDELESHATIPPVDLDEVLQSAGKQLLFDTVVCAHPERRAVTPAGIILEWAPEGGQCIVLRHDGRLTEGVVQDLLERVCRLVERVTDRPDARMSEISLLAPGEEERIARTAWGELTVVPDETLHGLVTAQAMRTPNRVALRYGRRSMTYAELDGASDWLARSLRNDGVGAESVVGVCAHRSLDTIVALLAVFKVGGAYAPLDPDLPDSRLSLLVKNLKCRLLLGEHDEPRRLAQLSGNAVRSLDGVATEGDSSLASTEPWVHPDSLAYVVFTSGSTGHPKSVMCTHTGALNFVRWVIQALSIGPDDIGFQLSAHSYDAWVWELFAPLAVGGRVVIAPQTIPIDSIELASTVREQRVSIMHCVPSMMALLLDVDPACCAEARWVCCSGEPLTSRMIHALRKAGPTGVANFYGVTEATIDQTAYFCPAEGIGQDNALAGKPLWNTSLRLLDPDQRPIPPGAIGEVYVGGAGVTRGYKDMPRLTAERFVPDPYDLGKRMYRTGDLGRIDDNGDLAFLGRRDDQVKLDGIRVECGEIEASLLTEPDVDNACVIVSPQHQSVIAYVTGRRSKVGTLRERMAKQLPRHMVPGRIVWLDRFPLTTAGKVDRRALANLASDPSTADTEVQHASGRTETEQRIARIWEEVLGVNTVGLNDNFYERGGTSLLAARVLAEIRRRLLPQSGLTYPTSVTVSAMAAEVDAITERHSAAKPSEFGSVDQRLAMLSPQRRALASRLLADAGVGEQGALGPVAGSGTERQWTSEEQVQWQFYGRTGEYPAFHTAVQLDLAPGLRVDELAAAVRGVVHRHRIPAPPASTGQQRPVEIRTPREYEGDLHDVAEWCVRTPFVVDDTLFRVAISGNDSTSTTIVLCGHDLAVDRWSLRHVAREIMTGHGDDDPVRYEDVQRWRASQCARDEANTQLSHWRSVLTDVLPPIAPAQPHNRSGCRIPLALKEDDIDAARRFANVHGCSLLAVGLAAWGRVVRAWRPDGPFVIGCCLPGRSHAATTEVVGPLANPVLLRCEARDAPTLAEEVRWAQKVVTAAARNSDVPVTDVLGTAAPHLPASVATDVTIGVVEDAVVDLDEGGVQGRICDLDLGTAKEALRLEFVTGPAGGGTAHVEFRPDAYPPMFVEQLAFAVADLLRQMSTEGP